MKDGYVRVAAVSFEVRPADCRENAARITALMRECDERKVKLAVFPELCVTGYTCGDLFLQPYLLEDSRRALSSIAASTEKLDVLAAVGLPFEHSGKLYNAAAVLHRGRVLGIVPKSVIPNYAEYYELRHFTPADKAAEGDALFDGQSVPFGTDLLFCCRQTPGFTAAFEICDDLWGPFSPSERHAQAGALIIGNLSASSESVGKSDYRRDLVRVQSARLSCAYVYASCGAGESSTDLVFSGHRLICENGNVLAERTRYDGSACEIVMTEADVSLLSHERRRMNIFPAVSGRPYRRVMFDISPCELDLMRKYSRTPFVPYSESELSSRCAEALSLQATGLAQRVSSVRPRRLVLGLSGGLDSTLALLVSKEALRRIGRPVSDILAVTMPGPGTTERTLNNARRLAQAVGAELREIAISAAVESHLRDIGHNNEPDTAYENAQARERMQVLMDIANMEGGLVVGTPDLSEIALGFSTYGGDHMSMYGVNSGVPKTLIRHLIAYMAKTGGDSLNQVLMDILDTPVSPELLPVGADGENAQHTEKLIGDYVLHDFMLYYFIRFGFPPRKLMRLLRAVFGDTYGEEQLRFAHRTFFKRFFANQFKRSCMPDGVKIGTVALSPRGDFRMPSDVSLAGADMQ